MHIYDKYLAAFFLECKMVSDKACRRNQNKFYIKNFPENRAIYETMWKNMVQPDRPHMEVDTSHALFTPDN